MSQFDTIANQILQDALLLNEMPVKKLKGAEDYKFDPSHATYSAFSRKPTSGRASAEGTDPYDEQVQNKVVILTIKKIIDDLDSAGGETDAPAKDYQYKIAEFIRQSINEVIPDSLKPSEKPYTAQDGYAARAILAALQEQGIVATERSKAKESFDKIQETPGALKQAVKDVAATSEVKTAIADDIQSDSEDETEDVEDSTSEAEPEERMMPSGFDTELTYEVANNIDTIDLDTSEKYALDKIESGSSGEEMIKSLSSSLRLRDVPTTIPKILQALVAKGALIPGAASETSTSKSFGDRGSSAEDAAKEMRFDVPKENPYTGSIE